MEILLEELKLLGLVEATDEELHSHGIVHFMQATQALLELYHKTFKEKKNLEELCSNLISELKKIKEDKHQLADRFAAQEILLSNLQHKQKILIAQLDDNNQQLIKSKKEAAREKLKWERWAQLERASLCRSLQQASTLRTELRKKTCVISPDSQRPLSPLPVGQIVISRGCPLIEAKEHDSITAANEDLLKKVIRRWDSAHRSLVKECADASTSLQSINASLQQSVNALTSCVDLDMRKWLSSEDFESQMSQSTSPWISHIVDNIRQNCLKLSKVTTLMQDASPDQRLKSDSNKMERYMHSLDKFGEALDRAEKAFLKKT